MCHCFSHGAVCPSSSSTSGSRSHQSTLSISAIQMLIKAVICQREWNSALRCRWFVQRRDPVWDRVCYEIVFCTWFRFTCVQYLGAPRAKSQSVLLDIVALKNTWVRVKLLRVWTCELRSQIQKTLGCNTVMVPMQISKVGEVCPPWTRSSTPYCFFL